jgi:hypothetical protein
LAPHFSAPHFSAPHFSAQHFSAEHFSAQHWQLQSLVAQHLGLATTSVAEHARQSEFPVRSQKVLGPAASGIGRDPCVTTQAGGVDPVQVVEQGGPKKENTSTPGPTQFGPTQFCSEHFGSEHFSAAHFSPGQLGLDELHFATACEPLEHFTSNSTAAF